MLGVCAVVLALLGTIVLGTVTAVEETSDPKVGYRTVADVTGLVATSKDPYFTDYNPNKNWTGYAVSGSDSVYISGVDFTTTTQANNYPIFENDPRQTPGTINLDGLGESVLIGTGYDDVRDFTSTIGNGRPYRNDMKFTTLTNVVNSLKTQTTISIEFNAGTLGINPTRAYFSPQSNGASSPFSPMVGQGSLYFGDYWWHANRSEPNLEPRVLEGICLVDVGTMTASFTQVNQTYYPEYYNVPTDLILVIWGGTGVEGTTTGGSTYTPNPLPSTVSYIKTDSNVQYMDVSKGVSLNTYGTADNVDWVNTYYNGSVNMILKGSSGSAVSMSIPVSTWNGNNWTGATTNTILTQWVTESGVYKTKITLNGADPVSIGGWNNVLLRINTEAGEVVAEPITYFGNYTTYTTATPVIIGNITKGAFNKITYLPLSGVTAPEMEVINTRVYMNTYGAVFRDASLDVSTYFPDYPNYAVSFGNLALTGTALQVNGVDLPVSDKSFTFNDKTYPLQGASVVYANGKVSIQGNDYGIDLGDIVDRTIFFTGIWYMPITFKESYTYLESAYEWIPYGFGLDHNAFILAFAGITLGIMFLASTFKVKPKAMDWVVVIFAGFIAVGLLVVP